MWQAMLLTIRAAAELRRGGLAAAEVAAQHALTVISHKCWGVAIGAPLACVLLAQTAMGRLSDAAAYLSVPVPEATFRTPFGLHYLRARGRHYLATGRLRAALGDFQACGEMLDNWDRDVPMLLPWRLDVAQAYLAMGEREQARDVALEQLAQLEPDSLWPRGTALRLLAATSPVDQRPALLEEAVDVLQRSGDKYETASALADLSDAHRALGEVYSARALGQRAYGLAERCGAEPLRRRLLEGLRDIEVEIQSRRATGDASIGDLTEAELRVAALAVQGHTNRQIAKVLFVTVSTVEQHLTRVYRKLNVRRRTDLPKELRDYMAEPGRPVAV
jgi:DNA-binding CsgD family transcriptional regulator